MKLRPYQSDGIERLRRGFLRVRKQLFVAPTGAGKTVLAAHLATSAVLKSTRVWFIAHRTELIKQGFQKFARYGVPVDRIGIIMAGTKLPEIGYLPPASLPADENELYAKHARRRPLAPCQVASIDTLRNRLKDLEPAKTREEADLRGDPQIIVIDEAHRSLSPSYVRLFELFPFALFVGLTATPYRADGRGLGALYEDMVVVAQPSELITIGAILEPRVFTVPAKDLPNLASVKIKGGDYDPTQLTAAVDQKGLVGNIVENWQRRAQGRSTVVFAASVEHSKHIRDRFVEAGIKAEHVDGTTPADEREAILARVASGETLVLCNMGVATEGYDCPRVKCCVLARPTKSLGLTIQMAGRILRPWVDAFGNTVEPIILDHAGCILEHGFPTTDREFDLDDKPKRASKKNDAPVKVCEECFAIVAAASPTCTVCGWEFPAKEKGAFEEAEGDLVEVTKVSLDDKKQRYAELLKEAERTGRKPGWAYYRYKEQFNEEPPKGVKPAAAPKLDASDEEMKTAWEVLVEECRDRGYKPAWVGVRFKAMFGRDVPSGFLIDALKASVAPYEPTSEWGF